MAPSGVQTLRVISGDHELSALDFQKHYRLGVVHLMDTDRTFEKKYNRNGWPFLMVVDAKGQVVYTCNNLIDSDPALKKELQKIKQTKSAAQTVEADGIRYMAATLDPNTLKADVRNDRFTSIAAGKDGRVFAVYTSVRNGNSDILMRLWDGKAFTEVPVAATTFDEYDAAVAVDAAGRPWVCWTGNSTGRYNIFLTNLSDLKNGKPPIQISAADDDAMHGRLACDGHGAVWVTYYRWQKMGGTSRDKEVYLRRWADGNLSKEIQVSPTDVPSYEDHTDPAIACLGDGAVVCWSWDYHKPQGYPQECDAPTIFARTIQADMTAGAVFPLSGKAIESVPALSGPVGGVTWCAWDALSGAKKSLCVRALSPQGAVGSAAVISDGLKHLCSPSFAFFKTEKGCLVWAETTDGQTWRLARAEYDAATKSWGKKQRLEEQQNPRYPSAAYDNDGTLWIAYSVRTPKGRDVVIKSY